MAGWDGLRTNISQHTEELHQETGTNKIQRRTSNDVKGILQSFQNGILTKSLEFLKENDVYIKQLCEIPELHDITIDRIFNVEKKASSLAMDISTAYTWDIRQLLLNNWFNKNNFIANTEWIRLRFYWSNLQLFIKQDHLSK